MGDIFGRKQETNKNIHVTPTSMWSS